MESRRHRADEGIQRDTLLGPDDVQVRIVEDSKLTSPVAADGLIMNVANAGEVSAWYAKWFGAKVSRSGRDTIGEIPGARSRVPGN